MGFELIKPTQKTNANNKKLTRVVKEGFLPTLDKSTEFETTKLR